MLNTWDSSCEYLESLYLKTNRLLSFYVAMNQYWRIHQTSNHNLIRITQLLHTIFLDVIWHLESVTLHGYLQGRIFPMQLIRDWLRQCEIICLETGITDGTYLQKYRRFLLVGNSLSVSPSKLLTLILDQTEIY